MERFQYESSTNRNRQNWFKFGVANNPLLLFAIDSTLSVRQRPHLRKWQHSSYEDTKPRHLPNACRFSISLAQLLTTALWKDMFILQPPWEMCQYVQLPPWYMSLPHSLRSSADYSPLQRYVHTTAPLRDVSIQVAIPHLPPAIGLVLFTFQVQTYVPWRDVSIRRCNTRFYLLP